jgi:quercetin dioxygenase-like cupin family protein
MRSTRFEDAPRLRPLKGVDMTILGSGEKITFIRIVIQPCDALPRHSHPNEQIGVCLEGEGELASGDKTIRVEPGVSWTIPAHEPHSFTAKGTRPVVVYEVWSPPREDYLSMATRRG